MATGTPLKYRSRLINLVLLAVLINVVNALHKGGVSLELKLLLHEYAIGIMFFLGIGVVFAHKTAATIALIALVSALVMQANIRLFSTGSIDMTSFSLMISGLSLILQSAGICSIWGLENLVRRLWSLSPKRMETSLKASFGK